MKPTLRILMVISAGFLIVQAHTVAPIIALFCLVPLLMAMYAPHPTGESGVAEPLSKKEVALMGFGAYTFAAAPVIGMGQYGIPIYGAAVLYLAMGGALFGLLAAPFISSQSRLLRCVGVTLAWIIADQTRTLTPYSYPVMLGPCLGDIPILSQLASVAGTAGLDGFVALLSALLTEAIESRFVKDHPWLPRTRPRRWFAAAACLLLLVVAFGAGRIALSGSRGPIHWHEGSTEEIDPEETVVVSMIQGGVPTWLYRRASVFSRLQQIIDENYLRLYDRARALRPWGAPSDWVIFPEAAFGRVLPRNIENELEAIPGLVERDLPEGSALLLGATRFLKSYDPEYPAAAYENVLMVAEGNPLTITDTAIKGLLVPIAEARFRPAKQWLPMETSKARIGTLICYESMYPRIAHAMAKSGADVLVVVTNDAGMRWSLAPRVHARLGRLRAIETGMSLLHAGQAGITFAVDPYGQSSKEVGLFERDVLTVAVPRKRVWTLYTLVGDALFYFFIAAWLAALALNWRMKKSRIEKEST